MQLKELYLAPMCRLLEVSPRQMIATSVKGVFEPDFVNPFDPEEIW